MSLPASPRTDSPGPRLSLNARAKPGALRLAVDLSHLRPGGESGGVKPFIIEYLRELAALEGDNLVFIFLTSTAAHAEIRQLARPYDELVCVRHNDPAALPTLGNWRSGESFIPDPPANLLLLLRATLFYTPLISPEFACPGVPTVSTFVDVLHRDYPQTLPPADNAYRETLFKELVRISDKLQCISRYTADQMVRHFGVPADRTFCSHIVIHQRFKAPARPPADQTGAKPYFFYPANAWPHKNHTTLLVAYRQYRRRHGAGAWSLVLTGHGNESMRRILDSARHLGLEDSVFFHGHLPDAEFVRLWNEAGALVFPSLHEGFGIPLIEAMHFNLPILSSRAGSLPEVAQEAALYADPLDPSAWADAMLEIATNAPLRAALAAKGRQRLSEFSLSAEIAGFRQVVHSVARAPARRWHKGVHVDGWMEGLTMLGLPQTSGPFKIELRLAPSPVARRLRFYHGTVPLGGLDVPAATALTYSLEIQDSTSPLVLEVPDASNLNPDDHRMHGVILAAVSATDEHGRTYNLLENQP